MGRRTGLDRILPADLARAQRGKPTNEARARDANLLPMNSLELACLEVTLFKPVRGALAAKIARRQVIRFTRNGDE
jgi:hypothetical protein